MDIDWFIEKNEKKIYRYCLRLCGSKELAEELTQETFIKVWANFAILSIQPEEQCLAWTFTTARNLTFDFLKSKKRELQYFEENTLDEFQASPTQSKTIEKLMGNLNPDMQEAILLKYEYGLNSREIAKKLATPEGTIRRRIQLGIKKLKEKLED